MKFKAIIIAATFLAAGVTQAAPLVFNLNTLTLNVPEVQVGPDTFNIIFHYDPDGRLTITSATPVVVSNPSGNNCSFQYEDIYGTMNLTYSKITRSNPSAPNSASQPYIKMVGKVVSGTPFFCGLRVTATQNGRQLTEDAFHLQSDTVGADSGYPECAQLQPGTGTVLYQSIEKIKYAAAFFDPNAPLSITYSPIGGASASCSF